MKSSILVDTKKLKERTKNLQIEECWKQRDKQIRAYQAKNPFSVLEWNRAFMCGWLTQHGIRYWDFPSPEKHAKNLWFAIFKKFEEERRDEFLAVKAAHNCGWLQQHALSFWHVVFNIISLGEANYEDRLSP